MRYRGKIANLEEAVQKEPQVGDVFYNTTDTHNYVWSGTEWSVLTDTVDFKMSNYELNKCVIGQMKELTPEEVDKKLDRIIPIFATTRICGTVIAKDDSKNSISILTKNSGVVNVKFTLDYYAKYNTHENTTYIKTHFPNIRNLNINIFKFNQFLFTTIHVVKYENISMRHICPMLIIIN